MNTLRNFTLWDWALSAFIVAGLMIVYEDAGSKDEGIYGFLIYFLEVLKTILRGAFDIIKETKVGR
jgi:hypothetical protein